jgi:hypothetical protein
VRCLVCFTLPAREAGCAKPAYCPPPAAWSIRGSARAGIIRGAWVCVGVWCEDCGKRVECYPIFCPKPHYSTIYLHMCAHTQSPLLLNTRRQYPASWAIWRPVFLALCREGCSRPRPPVAAPGGCACGWCRSRGASLQRGVRDPIFVAKSPNATPCVFVNEPPCARLQVHP